ncbi:MAG: histidinol-phosphate aminotransferase family protein [Oscillospiraceae bacterium]|nr:histidinol-phosphate aminotransferase family protein [Oscillospiraceae bacterium]
MKIRNELLAKVRTYAGHTPHAAEDTLDCSLGVNPYGFPAAVKEAFADFDPERFYHYPHSHAPQKAIVDYWADYAFIEPENIVLTDGSVAALYLLCNILAKKGAEVVGFLPTFTDMVEYSRMMAMRYVGIPARQEDGWRMEVSDLVDAISADTSLVYIDRPNNPTGQTLPLTDIARVLDKCEELGVYCIVDEAYGDFIPREESAVTLGPRYKNIIIVRTFSKGIGLAGLRAGYIITTQNLIRYISKVSNPYMMSELSRELSAAALSDRTYGHSHSADFADMKAQLRSVCGENLTMTCTDDRVPICLLQHRDPRVDLQEELLRHGVLTCSGGEFEPLERNSVRLRVPRREEMDKLLTAVAAVEHGE